MFLLVPAYPGCPGQRPLNGRSSFSRQICYQPVLPWILLLHLNKTRSSTTSDVLYQSKSCQQQKQQIAVMELDNYSQLTVNSNDSPRRQLYRCRQRRNSNPGAPACWGPPPGAREKFLFTFRLVIKMIKNIKILNFMCG